MRHIPENTETLIIGAGPAGLAAAMELTKSDGDFQIFEKDSRVGGLAKTYTVVEDDLIFRTDNGPHRFFSKNKYLYEFIEDILHEKWIQVTRHTQQYIKGVFLDYPVNIAQTISVLGISTLIRSGFDYVRAALSYKVFRKPIRNFYDYAVANFGYTLAELNVLGYTEQVWGISTKNLHPDWARQRIAGLDFIAMAKNILVRMLPKRWRSSGAKSLVDEFYYPEYGSGLVYDAIAQRLDKYGHPVQMNVQTTSINHDGHKIKNVSFRNANGTEATIWCENLIESIHIDDFLKLLNPIPPASVIAAVQRLKYRSQVYLFITLNKEKVTKNQWIYFPDREIPFARMSEMKNFSSLMVPPGKTSVFIEFFCNQDDKIYSMSAEELFEIALPHLEPAFFRRSEVRGYYIFRGGKDYPAYDMNYKDNLKIVREYLDKFENLYYIGRPGRFKYTNQDHSLEMGILAARSVIEGYRYDLENIGAEKTYFEKGYTPTT